MLAQLFQKRFQVQTNFTSPSQRNQNHKLHASWLKQAQSRHLTGCCLWNVVPAEQHWTGDGEQSLRRGWVHCVTWVPLCQEGSSVATFLLQWRAVKQAHLQASEFQGSRCFTLWVVVELLMSVYICLLKPKCLQDLKPASLFYLFLVAPESSQG